MAYETADVRFRELWREFGRPSTPPRAYYPFGRLRNDDRLWEIPEETSLSTGREADLRVSEVKRVGISGGFRQEIYDLLYRHPALVSRAAHQILSEHFPPSIHHDILEAARIGPWQPSLHLDEPMPRRGRRVREYTPRNPRFRKDVLAAYDECCAVCEYDIRFGDQLLGIEAAHIRWHSHQGSDVVRNGLALCAVHHKALDRGALGLKAKSGGFGILISGEVHGRSPSARRLLGVRGESRSGRQPARPTRQTHGSWLGIGGRCFGREG